MALKGAEMVDVMRAVGKMPPRMTNRAEAISNPKLNHTHRHTQTHTPTHTNTDTDADTDTDTDIAELLWVAYGLTGRPCTHKQQTYGSCVHTGYGLLMAYGSCVHTHSGIAVGSSRIERGGSPKLVTG